MPLGLAWGPNHTASVSAVLRTTNAEAVPTRPTRPDQPLDRLDRGPLIWSWEVVARTEGRVTIVVVVDVLFTPNTPRAGDTPPEEIWNHRSEVAAQQPDTVRIGPATFAANPLTQQLVVAGVTAQVPLVIGWIRIRLSGNKTPRKGSGSRKRP